MAIYTYSGKILTVGNAIATAQACCCNPPIQATKWYCTRVRIYGAGTNCTPFATPDSDTESCMVGSDISMYGGWDVCFDFGSGTVWLSYISGPYDNEGACTPNCGTSSSSSGSSGSSSSSSSSNSSSTSTSSSSSTSASDSSSSSTSTSSSSSTSASDSSSSSSSQTAASVPCTCSGTLTGDYMLSGYTDGDLAACAACETAGSTPWDGVFGYSFDCTWDSVTGDQINGKGLAMASINLDTSGDPVCVWSLVIECYTEFTSEIIWAGEKGTGTDPTGTYTRSQGCDTTATLTVVASP